MKVERRDGSDERAVLTALITNDLVLGKTASRWDGELFASRWSNEIAKWCVKFYQKYGRAPRKAVESLFETWAERNAGDKDTINLIEKYLTALSNEYRHRRFDTQYSLDLAGSYFDKVKLLRLKDAIEADVEAGELDKAKAKVSTFSPVEMASGAIIRMLSDKEVVKRAVKQAQQKPLIVYPGALGNLFGQELARDSLVGILGANKRGKSWWLLDMAWRGLLQGNKVAFFEIGDMSEAQVVMRFATRAARRPHKSREGWPAIVRWPTFLDGRRPDFKEYRFTKPVSFKEATSAFSKVCRKVGEDSFRLSVYPNSSIGISGILSILKGWERRGWVPDLVCLDYADLLAPPPGYSESRDQVNANWKGLRRISQELHCLVITPTQSNAPGFSKEVLDRSNFSEDNRKLAHCTGMVGLNQDPTEKRNQIMRVNWVVLRGDDFSEKDCVHVAQCLPLANPAVLSSFLESQGSD